MERDGELHQHQQSAQSNACALSCTLIKTLAVRFRTMNITDSNMLKVHYARSDCPAGKNLPLKFNRVAGQRQINVSD